jgi:hypothetical protein
MIKPATMVVPQIDTQVRFVTDVCRFILWPSIIVKAFDPSVAFEAVVGRGSGGNRRYGQFISAGFEF